MGEGSRWFAVCGQSTFGPYMSQGIAIKIAANEARSFRQRAQPAKISIQDTQGEAQVEYCLCLNFKK
jgi:hypothetical protein